MRDCQPKIKRVLVAAMACVCTVVAMFSLALKFPQIFRGGGNSLSVLAAGLTAPEGARTLFTQGLPQESSSPILPVAPVSSAASVGEEASASQGISAQEASSDAVSQEEVSRPNPSSQETEAPSQPAETENASAEEVPYTGGPLEAGEGYYPINETYIGPSGIQFENFSVKNTCQTQIDIGAELEKQPDISIQKNGQPEVLIVHTHTCESYLETDSGVYPESFYPRTTDENYNVVAVGEAIAEVLTNAGVGVVHDKTIHDNPSYNGSYYRSEQTIQDNLARYPGIQVVLDIHRDALGSNETGKTKPTFIAEGKKAAQIMVVAGCDDDGTWGFPDWEYNLRFALRVQKTAETMYPGMTRPMQFCPSNYNLNLTHGSMLIEVGTDANTIGEAVYSGELLGNVLSSVFQELSG